MACGWLGHAPARGDLHVWLGEDEFADGLVEGETLACGTGVTAAAIITSELKGIAAPVKVQVQGGDILEVFFRKEGDRFLDVKLKGPADVAFQGKIEI